MSESTILADQQAEDDTGILFVQVTTLPVGVQPQTVEGTLKKIGRKELEAVGYVVDEIQNWLLEKISSLAQKPTKVALEFGIDVEGEAGVPFVTKGSIGANFKISMEWELRK